MEDNKELMEMEEEVTLSYDEPEEDESEITEVSAGSVVAGGLILAAVGYAAGKGIEKLTKIVVPKVKHSWSDFKAKRKAKKTGTIDVEAIEVENKKS